jgi:hypothetical protein
MLPLARPSLIQINIIFFFQYLVDNAPRKKGLTQFEIHSVVNYRNTKKSELRNVLSPFLEFCVHEHDKMQGSSGYKDYGATPTSALTWTQNHWVSGLYPSPGILNN